MPDVEETTQLVTDEVLAAELLEAVLKAQGSRARDRQIEIGPSGLGSCREFIRATMAGEPRLDSVGWKAEAWIGTIGGDSLEAIFEEQLGALTQQRITTRLPRLGVSVSGASDLIFLQKNRLVDLKSKDGFAKVMKEGPSIEHCIQVSTYTLGLVQQGILEEPASAALAYWDRSGREKRFLVLPIEWPAILKFVDMAESRLEDVMEAQEHIEAGDLAWHHALRDKKPAYCFSQKVLCPFRVACWGGSEWLPDGKVEAEEHIAAAKRVVDGREMMKVGQELVDEGKRVLEGVNGTTPDGWNIGWVGKNRLEVKRP